MLVTVALLAGLTVLALTKIDLRQVGRALAQVNGWWVAVAAILMVGTFLSRAESWFTAIRAALPGARIGRAVVTRVLLIGIAGSAVAPGRLGEAARAWLIARRAGGAREALATVAGTLLSQTLLNVLALVMLTIVALAGGAIPGADTGSIGLASVLPALGLAALVAVPTLLARGDARATGRLRRALAWVHGRLLEVRRGLTVLRRPGTAARSGGFQLAGWAMQCGSCYAVIRALGLERHAGIAAAAAVLVAVNVTAIVPATPSNLGVFQAACIAILAPSGVGAGSGLAYGLVLQAVEIGCSLALGLPSLFYEGISVSELWRHRHPGGVRGRQPDARTGCPAGDRPVAVQPPDPQQ